MLTSRVYKFSSTFLRSIPGPKTDSFDFWKALSPSFSTSVLRPIELEVELHEVHQHPQPFSVVFSRHTHANRAFIYSKHKPFRPITCQRPMSSSSDVIMNVFDRDTKRRQRDRILQEEDFQKYFYIKDEIGFRVFDRICDIKRTFSKAIDLGCGLGHVTKHITREQQLITDKIYMVELSKSLLQNAQVSADVPCEKLNIDEERLLLDSTLDNDTIDLIYSSLTLHWVNNLPSVFQQAIYCLKPDGVFLGSMFGSDTLYELRVSLQLAENEILGMQLRDD